MKTAWIAMLTLLLIALLPMWPHPEPVSIAKVFGALFGALVLVIFHTVISRAHHRPH